MPGRPCVFAAGALLCVCVWRGARSAVERLLCRLCAPHPFSPHPCMLHAQAALAPALLRRMKEDVETLPEKEEVIIWVSRQPPSDFCVITSPPIKMPLAKQAMAAASRWPCWRRGTCFQARHSIPPRMAQDTLQARAQRGTATRSPPPRAYCVRPPQVEMAAEQRAYYRALYGGQIGALLGGGSNKALPQMRNLAMELRKLCCHPVRAAQGGG